MVKFKKDRNFLFTEKTLEKAFSEDGDFYDYLDTNEVDDYFEKEVTIDGKTIDLTDNKNPVFNLLGEYSDIILEVRPTDSNCQIAIVDRFDDFINEFLLESKGFKVLDKILNFMDKPYYLFHVTTLYKNKIENFLEEYGYKIEYSNRIETYSSVQHHILLKNPHYSTD
jgi:hypothetical protein